MNRLDKQGRVERVMRISPSPSDGGEAFGVKWHKELHKNSAFWAKKYNASRWYYEKFDASTNTVTLVLILD